jgi:L,D-transpeptidase YbiS
MTAGISKERRRWLLAGMASTVLTILVLFVVASRLYVYEPLVPLSNGDGEQGLTAAQAKELQKAQSQTRRAERSLKVLAPRSVYIMVDTSSNRLYVKRGDKVLHEAVCSTGSGGLLKDPENDREWIFETPRGTFRVIEKRENPVWTKPDWAFVEEGKPVPTSWDERRDYDTLGDYALYFGNGYMIHGTLYQRYLGRSITHGCVRLGDEDLDRVYHLAPVGTPIFIF